MFERFPKTRPPLPREIEDVYSAQYKANREGATAASSIAQRAESWLHRRVARDVVDGARPRATLELGAGTLNQLDYEPEVGPYDVVEPFTALYEGSPRLSRIRSVYGDVAEVPRGNRYDRITSVAALEHMCDLPAAVARCGLLLSGGGVFRASIPSEGTWVWALGWRLTTGLEFRLRHGLDYGLMMKHEHVNTAAEIEEVLEYFFDETRCEVFGLSRRHSLYRYLECRRPRLDRCDGYLGSPRISRIERI